MAVALSIRLGVGELGRNPGGTSSVAAYEEFLRAQELDREHTPEALMQALEHTRNAVEIDPEFAMGWWMMASLYVQARRDERLQGEWHSAAERAVARVREIDPTLLALRVWDHYEHLRNQRWLEAERVLFPDGRFDALGQRDMLFEKGMFLYTVGRIRDAMPLMERQRRISPLGPGTAGILAHIYLAQSRMEEALAECEHAYRVGGWVGYTVVTCVVVAMASGDRGALETWLERIVAEHPVPRHQQLFAAMAENLDDRPAALALLRDTFEETTPEAHMDFYTAIWAAWYDDTELALAVMHRSPDNFFLWLPQMKDVRQQPGFKDLVRKMKLEEYWRASSWPDFCQPLRESDFECW